jgi:hypothetical protein
MPGQNGLSSFYTIQEHNFCANCVEVNHARAIAYNMEYNTPHRGKVIFSETLGLAVLTFKTKAAYNEFKKELAARFDI